MLILSLTTMRTGSGAAHKACLIKPPVLFTYPLVCSGKNSFFRTGNWE